MESQYTTTTSLNPFCPRVLVLNLQMPARRPVQIPTVGHPQPFKWVATSIHTRDNVIVEGAEYKVSQGSIIIFLQFYHVSGGICDPTYGNALRGLETVRCVITPLGGQSHPQHRQDPTVEIRSDVSNVRIDTSLLLGRYALHLAGRTFFVLVRNPLQAPQQAVIAQPTRPAPAPAPAANR